MQSQYQGLFFLILLTFYWELQVSSFLSDWRDKPGICPPHEVHCLTWNLHRCTGDQQCKGNLKCCLVSCRFMCVDPKIDICTLPLDVGKCKNSVLRFYFEKKTNQCMPFDYHRCGGNANNFFSLLGCQKNCVKTNITL